MKMKIVRWNLDLEGIKITIILLIDFINWDFFLI